MGSRDRQTSVPARWRAGDRFASVALRHSLAASSSVGVAAVGFGLAASWLAVYVMGGAANLVPHLYYVPILFAAVRFGPVAALSTALLAGLLAGPLTYLDVATETPQELDRWVSRTVFFATIGVAMAALVRPSLPSIGDDVGRLRTARRLRQALDAGELFVRYQPVLSMRTGAVYGVEALVRWDHPEHGELDPRAFVPDAEA
jgi:diguanylate cyclase